MIWMSLQFEIIGNCKYMCTYRLIWKSIINELKTNCVLFICTLQTKQAMPTCCSLLRLNKVFSIFRNCSFSNEIFSRLLKSMVAMLICEEHYSIKVHLFCTIFNWHNLVVPSADVSQLSSLEISWKYHQIVSIEDRAKHCFKNECTLVKFISVKLGLEWVFCAIYSLKIKMLEVQVRSSCCMYVSQKVILITLEISRFFPCIHVRSVLNCTLHIGY